ncbi:hypothetical protein E2986_11382 [Frieseomelitta varia]|uniref:Uncharacterized protein n=1 Tax=Frieseomelitta varia TaxID=561572 RepID=A0A833S973_9HYME|nr:hypothetical protein E2986_11382 [Frieseomelitta varia]
MNHNYNNNEKETLNFSRERRVKYVIFHRKVTGGSRVKVRLTQRRSENENSSPSLARSTGTCFDLSSGALDRLVYGAAYSVSVLFSARSVNGGDGGPYAGGRYDRWKNVSELSYIIPTHLTLQMVLLPYYYLLLLVNLRVEG